MSSFDITVDAVLFDIDGTLADSTASVERSWTRLAEAHGVDVERLLSVTHGRRARDTIEEFFAADQVDAAAAELLEYETNDLDGIVALPGALRILDGLPADLWAAVTSGGRDLMGLRLDAAGLPVPEVFIAAEDVAAGKPDPQGYRMAAERLGVDPARCLVVEDAPAGVGAGRNAGATVLAVGTSHDLARLSEAHHAVPDLRGVTMEPGPDGIRVRG
ncbi:HAD-IA family hydrolase [Micrococcus sp. FDAARGOS_333]|uniref:HAD-IA family hydrolase n=1 Tax=Micrococcus sp. FDAARGOS_333 TaxID=1930558 RepID=UPI001D125B57|nr:HAD-IA family hydrolase [Micrococcus sp. FDAARGOS_333]